MLRKLLLLPLLSIVGYYANAQYSHYEPLPYVPVPEISNYTPQFTIPAPPPNYNTPNNDKEVVYSIFSIEKAIMNDIDMSDNYVNEDAKIAIYSKNGKVNMTIIRLKTSTQSFGEISDLRSTTMPSTQDKYEAITSTFNWHFKSYSGKEEDAVVSITQVNNPNGITYLCKVLSPDRLFVFRGHKQR